MLTPNGDPSVMTHHRADGARSNRESTIASTGGECVKNLGSDSQSKVEVGATANT